MAESGSSGLEEKLAGLSAGCGEEPQQLSKNAKKREEKRKKQEEERRLKEEEKKKKVKQFELLNLCRFFSSVVFMERVLDAFICR